MRPAMHIFSMRLRGVLDILDDLYSPREAVRWLYTEHPALDNQRPMDLLVSREGSVKVFTLLQQAGNFG